MKNLKGFNDGLRHTEFAIATFLLIIALSEDAVYPVSYQFAAVLVRYGAAYLAFLAINFVFVPRIAGGRSVALNISYALSALLVTWLGLSFAGTYLREWLEGNAGRVNSSAYVEHSFWKAICIVLFIGAYGAIKQAGLYFLSRHDEVDNKDGLIRKDSVAASIIWLMLLFFLLVMDVDFGFVLIWMLVGLSAIAFYYWACYRLIPRSLSAKSPYMLYLWKGFWVVLLSVPIVSFIGFFLLGDEDRGFSIGIVNAFFLLFMVMPLSWIMFKRRLASEEELNMLRKELVVSNANIHFLRSQINPHFLFNALNTVYGTALQEKAGRTSEGIQKLGDMMRFMLDENVQDKIPLRKELDYLDNYISFQKLRTDAHPSVLIETDIRDISSSLKIAPMLLIPFVENAFKHGISFREPSFVRLTLREEKGVLCFDAANSKHARHEHDPEKDKGGIGLSNVKQRLQLLYRGKHHLTVQETASEFIVHLKIHLS